MSKFIHHLIDFPPNLDLSGTSGVLPKGNPVAGMAPVYSVRLNPAFFHHIGPDAPEATGSAPDTWTPTRLFLWPTERKKTAEQPEQVSKSMERAEVLFVA
jgi:hypothetical protein